MIQIRIDLIWPCPIDQISRTKPEFSSAIPAWPGHEHSIQTRPVNTDKPGSKDRLNRSIRRGQPCKYNTRQCHSKVPIISYAWSDADWMWDPPKRQGIHRLQLHHFSNHHSILFFLSEKKEKGKTKKKNKRKRPKKRGPHVRITRTHHTGKHDTKSPFTPSSHQFPVFYNKGGQFSISISISISLSR